MENKKVGFLIIGLSALMGAIIYLFNRALVSLVNATCSHGETCPMWQSINFQTNVSIGIMIFTILIGVYLIFSEQIDQLIFKASPEATEKITMASYKKIRETLNADEKKVFEKIIESNGSIFQSKLMEKTGFNKVKITRLLDKLEGKNLVERRRRGMSNIVILKH